MVEEPPVFGCNNRGRNEFRQLIERDVLVRRTALAECRTVAGQNTDERRVRRVPDGKRIGKYDGVVDHHDGEGQHQHAGTKNGRAKRQAVFELQAAEKPAPCGRRRLRLRRGLKLFIGRECLRSDGLKRSRKRQRRHHGTAAPEQHPADKPQCKTQSCRNTAQRNKPRRQSQSLPYKLRKPVLERDNPDYSYRALAKVTLSRARSCEDLLSRKL